MAHAVRRFERGDLSSVSRGDDPRTERRQARDVRERRILRFE
jgi:hypothetical protein